MICMISPSPASNLGRGQHYHMDIPDCIGQGDGANYEKLSIYVSPVIKRILKNVWITWLPPKRKYFVFHGLRDLHVPSRSLVPTMTVNGDNPQPIFSSHGGRRLETIPGWSWDRPGTIFPPGPGIGTRTHARVGEIVQITKNNVFTFQR